MRSSPVAVVKTPPVVNTEGFTVSVVESSDVAGAAVTRRQVPDATGRAVFAMGDAAARFYRLAASDDLGGVQLWENGPYWAECNVGAAAPEEYGYYFWWGDTVGYVRSGGTWTDGWKYTDVTWVSSTGETMNESPFIQSSCPTHNKDHAALLAEGYIDSTGNLVAEHDAATAHLGAPWRMPTDADFAALVDNCTTTWTTQNGVVGRLVTGKGAYADRSIFLPAAGSCGELELYASGEYGYNWDSTPKDDSWLANLLYFNSRNLDRSGGNRYSGRSVRPVRDPTD